MGKLNRTLILSALVTAIPSAAMAADSAATSPTGTAGVIAAIAAGAAGLVSAVGALISAIRSNRAAAAAGQQATEATARAAAADARSAQALAWADHLANAHSDGVVLVLSYPGTVTPCRAMLEANGWRVQHYRVTQAELDAGQLLPGPHVIDDVRAADAIVIEGLDEVHMAILASMRDFRDHIRGGASVCMYTGGGPRRYDLTLWGECDQGVTTPVTTEAAVRASLARRDATTRRQGIRPGQMAAAREALLGK